MKKTIFKSFAIILALIIIAVSALPAVSAATVIDSTRKVFFTVNCDKDGYTFEVFKVADLDTTSASPYETKYVPLFY